MPLWFSQETLRIPVKSLPRRKIRGFWAESEESDGESRKVADKFPGAGKRKQLRLAMGYWRRPAAGY
jgi:hypothetical protein